MIVDATVSERTTLGNDIPPYGMGYNLIQTSACSERDTHIFSSCLILSSQVDVAHIFARHSQRLCSEASMIFSRYPLMGVMEIIPDPFAGDRGINMAMVAPQRPLQPERSMTYLLRHSRSSAAAKSAILFHMLDHPLQENTES